MCNLLYAVYDRISDHCARAANCETRQHSRHVRTFSTTISPRTYESGKSELVSLATEPGSHGKLPVPPAVDAREGPGDARQARPRRARQPQVHVRGPAAHPRARQGDTPRRKRVPRRTRSKGRRRRRRRRRRRQGGGGGHGTRALGEPAKRGAAPAAATRALGQDLEHPGGALAGRPRRRVLLVGGQLRALAREGFPAREADRGRERRGSHAADDRILAGLRRHRTERRGYAPSHRTTARPLRL